MSDEMCIVCHMSRLWLLSGSDCLQYALQDLEFKFVK